MIKTSEVKIGCSVFEVQNFLGGVDPIIIQHYLDEHDDAIVSYMDEQDKEIPILKFDSACHIFNTKGTLVGTLRMSEPNIHGYYWDFFKSEMIEGKIVSTMLLQTKKKYPFEAEPDIIKWLAENDLLKDLLVQ